MRLIDADALAAVFSERQRKLWTEHSYAKAREADRAQYLVHEVPTIEAEPVRHGQWIHTASSCSPFCEVLRCSHCSSEDETGCCYNYCPNCGAKMDGEIHE